MQENLQFKHAAFETFQVKKSDIDTVRGQIVLNDKDIRLKEITVSANRWEQPVEYNTQHIQSITGKQIDLVQPQTSADLLSTTGEVFVQKSQMGGGSPMIRGFAANSILLVVDGVRMNNAIYRSGNLHNII